LLLTKTFSAEQYEAALESWPWIGLHGKTPVLSSLFGDLFLQDRDGYWFLDTMEGILTHIWANRDAVQAELDTPEGQDRYLLGGLAVAAERRGVILGANEVYDLVTPPILGGSFDLGSVTATDFVVKVNLAGQLHDQLRRLPPGTKISGVSFDGATPAGKDAPPPRRRRWGRRS
jgi:hypothetical protein